MRASVRLTLARNARWVPTVRGLAGCLLRQLGAPDDDAADLQLALTEACANVVRHAVGTDSYTVGLAIECGGCEIEIADLGPGFDEGREQAASDGVEQAALDGAADAEAETGRGLDLMRALVDDLELRADTEVTRLVLRKRWSTELDATTHPGIDAESVALSVGELTGSVDRRANAARLGRATGGGAGRDGEANTGRPGASEGGGRSDLERRVQRSRPFRPGESDRAWRVGHDDGDERGRLRSQHPEAGRAPSAWCAETGTVSSDRPA